MELIIIVVSFILDQVSKYIVAGNAAYHQITVIPRFFEITYLKNTGAAWSMMSGQQALLSLIAVVAIGVMLYVLMKARKNHLLYTRIAMALMISGAAGNLYDRLIFQYVRDFLNFYIFGYDFPVFNIADSALTIGVIVLIIAILKGEDESKKGENA